MTEQETPPETGSEESSAPPPESPPPASDETGVVSPNRNLMIVLSYLWILFVIPLLIEKDDQEVQWHAKNGLVLSVVEFILHVLLSVTGIGCFFTPFLFLAFAVIRLMGIVKGLNGQRLMVPVLSEYASKF